MNCEKEKKRKYKCIGQLLKIFWVLYSAVQWKSVLTKTVTNIRQNILCFVSQKKEYYTGLERHEGD